MGRFFRSSLRTGRIYRSSNYGQFTQSMSPNYKNQWLADGGHRPRQSSVFLVLVLLLRIVPLVGSIENFEALRDTILSKQVCVRCRCLRSCS